MAQATYHHGDLRRALLDAALTLVDQHGIEGVSLREVARRARVSHNAPYHHFPDKRALVAAVAEESYDLLHDDMAAARRHRDALDRLRAIGVAYVRFAVLHPRRFRLMNRPELRSAGRVTAVERAGERCEGLLRDEIATAQAAGILVGEDPQAIGLAAWSTVHGLATLIVDGPLRHRVGSLREAARMTRSAIDLLLVGLVRR